MKKLVFRLCMSDTMGISVSVSLKLQETEGFSCRRLELERLLVLLYRLKPVLLELDF